MRALNSIADGALWAATQEGGLSRIKDGRVATLTARNGLPCDTIHWSIEDADRSLWLYAVCGLVRITRTELDAWIADPKRRIETAVWDAADGAMLKAVSPAYYNPPVAKSTDGRLWFQSGDGVQVVDPRHLPFNKVPPPVHIEQVFADGRLYWQHLPGETVSNKHLPPLTRDLQIDYVGLSFVAPERMQRAREARGGLGLVNMRERARQLGSTFELDSRPGGGRRFEWPSRSESGNEPAGADSDSERAGRRRGAPLRASP